MRVYKTLFILLFLPVIIIAQNDPGPTSYEPSDPCCPALEGYTEAGCGWQYDGEKCVFDIGVDIDDYEMFFWDNQLWVLPSCPDPVGDECCPDGFKYDGWNACYFVGDSDVHTNIPDCLPYIIDNSDKWMYDDIYTQDGNLYMELKCCECPQNELEWDENLVWNNSPNSDLIPRSFYDGNGNCKTFTNFDPNTNYFVYNGLFTIDKDCDEYGEENFCCPDGFSWNGGNGCFLIGYDNISNEDWFVWDGSLYFKAECCPDAFHTKADLCDWFEKTRGYFDREYDLQEYEMNDAGSLDFDFITYCVRDQVIVRINGDIIVDSGSYSSSACGYGDDVCQGQYLNPNCENAVFGCGSSFEGHFSWDRCDHISLEIIGDVCNEGTTSYDFECD